MDHNKKLRILETTLRDGSYEINFKFTAADTRIISASLEKAGFELIEIGHGVGLNASCCGKGEASEPDESYLKAAAETLKKAKFGMFCIPGIAKIENIDMAADYGMGFIRIGTNVTEVEDSQKFIERAKKYGMFVSSNLMKSYAMEPKEFAKRAQLAHKYGSDVLCIVDSAGGMLPKEMEQYILAVREVCDIPLAYHGHNNLGLAVGNSLRAVELGVSIVDSSLQGLGRSAGNAPTEILVAALERMGVNTGIDLFEVLDAGEKYIKPLITNYGISSIDVTAGYAQFHSSYMDIINKFASKYMVDPRRVIVGVCKEDKENAPEPIVERVAKELASQQTRVYVTK